MLRDAARIHHIIAGRSQDRAVAFRRRVGEKDTRKNSSGPGGLSYCVITYLIVCVYIHILCA